MTVGQEVVYRVSKTRKGCKVRKYNGHGLAEDVFTVEDTRYFYDDAEEKAHGWAERKAEENDDSRVVGLGETL